MSDTDAPNIRPLASYVKIGIDGQPRLEGIRCSACGEVMALALRRACPKCAAIGTLSPVPLSERGRLYTYTVVHRSFPGVETPFVAALVDLDGGGSVKGNLVGVAEADIRFDMPVHVEFETIDRGEDPAGQQVRPVFVAANGPSLEEYP